MCMLCAVSLLLFGGAGGGGVVIIIIIAFVIFIKRSEFLVCYKYYTAEERFILTKQLCMDDYELCLTISNVRRFFYLCVCVCVCARARARM